MHNKNSLYDLENQQEIDWQISAKIAYESRLKYILDEEAGKQDAHAAGYREGIEQGIELGREQTAITMLAEGMPPQLIAKMTGLSLEKIQQLRSRVDERM